MKEIAARLGEEEWSLIDATLRQFGLPKRETWSGTGRAYVLEMIQDAKDKPLVELAQSVGYQAAELEKPGVEPRFWRKDMLRVFISHLSRERKIATDLQEALLPYGVSGFVAHIDIEPTSEWQTQIETALATCDALVALLHDGFHESNWTDQEIGFAMGRGVPVYSVKYGQNPYGFIGRFQAFPASRKSAGTIATALFDKYRIDKQTQAKMAEVLVTLFEESGTYAEAKARIAYLEDLETWDPSYPARIRAAAKSNSQISGSWGVQEKVVALAKKWARGGA